MSLKRLTIRPDETPTLRVGLKWDPLEKDFIQFTHQFDKPGEAQLKIVTAAGFSSIYGVGGSLLRKLRLFPKVADRLEGSAQDLQEINAIQKKYQEEKNLPSFDLDLLCFCYNKERELSQMVSPFSLIPKDAAKAQMSIIHSGPEPDGVGVGFDEEIFVTLGDIANDVQQIFFVVSSENHGFNEIKGGRCSVISTRDEALLLTKDLVHNDKQQTYIFARMERDGDVWSLQEVSDYIHVDEDAGSSLDDTIDDILRNKYLK